MESLEARVSKLEALVQRLADELAIYQLIAAYGPAVDSRDGAATAALWSDDATYDFGSARLEGREMIGALVGREPHVSYVAQGCAHVLSLPRVMIEGDHARAVNHSRVYLKSGEGWKVERASANLWHLRRESGSWRVTSRQNRLLDGSPAATALLAQLSSECRMPAPGAPA